MPENFLGGLELAAKKYANRRPRLVWKQGAVSLETISVQH